MIHHQVRPPGEGLQGARESQENRSQRLRVKERREIRQRLFSPLSVWLICCYQTIYHQGWRRDGTIAKALDYLSHLLRAPSQTAAMTNQQLDAEPKAFLSSLRRKRQQVLDRDAWRGSSSLERLLGDQAALMHMENTCLPSMHPTPTTPPPWVDP